ncbi:MAG: hypothetical protein HZA35_00160 [Parcubacteria group bacterium]|nr:hypothetical protein [Parcubacteria group bacterium]
MKHNPWYQFGNITMMILLRVLIVYGVLMVIIQLPICFLAPGLIVLFAILYLILPRYLNGFID